jgi:hypothetical protein
LRKKIQLQEVKTVLEGRKRQRSGKRLVIKDKVVVTTQDVVDRIQAVEAEAATKKGKKQTKKIVLKLKPKEKM